MCRDLSHPETNLATSATQDTAARFFNLAAAERYDLAQDVHHRCVLSVPKRDMYLTGKELFDLRYLGVNADCFSTTCYSVAHIMGVHFRAGEWGKSPRCGSVVTCVLEGESLYARVKKFIMVQGDNCPGYAAVSWFGKPQYPTGTPLIVKVGEDGGSVLRDHGSIVRITQIDPSRVMVECPCEPTSNTYYVKRDSGFDTIKNQNI